MKNNTLKRIAIFLAMIFVFSFTLTGCGDLPDEQTWTLSYADDAGIHTITVKYGEAYSIDVLPKREGNHFLGLFDAEVGGTQYITSNGLCVSVFTDMQNKILYPHWEPEHYTLLLHYEGAPETGPDSIEVSYGDRIQGLPEDFYVEGSEFIGWYTTPNASGTKFTNGAAMNKSLASFADESNRISLYAIFDKMQYTVRFYSYDGKTLLAEKQVAHGTDISQVAPKTLSDGSEILSWSTSKERYDEYTGEITESMSFYVKYYTCTLILDSGDGKPSETITVSSGEEQRLPQLSRTGYTLQGWKNEDGKVVADAFGSYRPTKNETLTAYWAPNDYLVTFQLDGEIAQLQNAEGKTVDRQTVTFDAAFKFPKPMIVDDRYTFMGWYLEDDVPLTDENGTGLDVWNIDRAATVVARFSKIQFTVTFLTGGGDPIEPMVVDKGDSITLPSAAKTGYTFTGWKTADGDSLPAKELFTPTASTTLTAEWTPNEYTVTLQPNGGKLKDDAKEQQTVTYGKTFSLPVAERENYEFLGWYTNDERQLTNENGIGLSAWAIADDVDVVAKYYRIEYTITFNANGGSSVDPKTVYKGDSIYLPTTTKTGYTLTGWKTADGELLQPEKSYTPDASVTLRAEWTPNEYTVTLQLEGGGLKAGTDTKVKVTYGKSFSLPVATRENYDFLGWYTSEGKQLTNASGGGLTVWNIAGDTTAIAQYRRIEYIITFNANGGSSVAPKTVYKGDSVTLPESSKTGYIFNCWKTASGEKVTSPYKPTGSITLYADWTADGDIENFMGGNGTSEKPYRIKTAQHFANIRLYPDAYFVLTENIDLTGSAYTPIATFSGNLDGGNYTISNLTIRVETAASVVRVGMFEINTGTVRNLRMSNCQFVASPRFNNSKIDVYCGAIAAINRGTIENCQISDTTVIANSSDLADKFRNIYHEDPREILRGAANWKTWISQSFDVGTSNWTDNLQLGVCSGGIAGENLGQISCCSFIGNVEANLYNMFGERLEIIM